MSINEQKRVPKKKTCKERRRVAYVCVLRVEGQPAQGREGVCVFSGSVAWKWWPISGAGSERRLLTLRGSLFSRSACLEAARGSQPFLLSATAAVIMLVECSGWRAESRAHRWIYGYAPTCAPFSPLCSSSRRRSARSLDEHTQIMRQNKRHSSAHPANYRFKGENAHSLALSREALWRAHTHTHCSTCAWCNCIDFVPGCTHCWESGSPERQIMPLESLQDTTVVN
jgi:hypothetical protein